MAMLTLNGIVQNVFDTPESTDRKTGKSGPPPHAFRCWPKTSCRTVRSAWNW